MSPSPNTKKFTVSSFKSCMIWKWMLWVLHLPPRHRVCGCSPAGGCCSRLSLAFGSAPARQSPATAVRRDHMGGGVRQTASSSRGDRHHHSNFFISIMAVEPQIKRCKWTAVFGFIYIQLGHSTPPTALSAR